MKRAILISTLVLILIGCREKNNKESGSQKLTQEQIIEINRELIIKDRERIENYISRKGLKMQETSSGLWYSIIKPGTGDQIDEGSAIEYEFECNLLDGTHCYSSVDSGTAKVIIGRSDLTSGLDEGFRLLNKGSEATFIIPSYLAYGMLGDGNMIPSRAVIVYWTKVVSTK